MNKIKKVMDSFKWYVGIDIEPVDSDSGNDKDKLK